MGGDLLPPSNYHIQSLQQCKFLIYKIGLQGDMFFGGWSGYSYGNMECVNSGFSFEWLRPHFRQRLSHSGHDHWWRRYTAFYSLILLVIWTVGRISSHQNVKMPLGIFLLSRYSPLNTVIIIYFRTVLSRISAYVIWAIINSLQMSPKWNRTVEAEVSYSPLNTAYRSGK